MIIRLINYMMDQPDFQIDLGRCLQLHSNPTKRKPSICSVWFEERVFEFGAEKPFPFAQLILNQGKVNEDSLHSCCWFPFCLTTQEIAADCFFLFIWTFFYEIWKMLVSLYEYQSIFLFPTLYTVCVWPIKVSGGMKYVNIWLI